MPTIVESSSSTSEQQQQQLRHLELLVENEERELYGDLPSSSSYDHISHYLDSLSEVQRDKLEELKNRVRLLSEWIHELPDQVRNWLLYEDKLYYRVLQGYGWEMDMNEAVQVVHKMAKWRADKKPYQIRLKDLGNVGKSGLVHHYGFDRMNRPILYVNMRHLNDEDNSTENVQHKFFFIVYGIEKCMARMHEKVARITCIFDMRDSHFNMGHVTKMKDMFLELGCIYPDMLHVNIICNATWTQCMLWKCVSLFIDKSVLQRYIVLRKSDQSELSAVLDREIEKSQLLDSMGGPVKNPYNYEKIVTYETNLEKCTSVAVSSVAMALMCKTPSKFSKSTQETQHHQQQQQQQQQQQSEKSKEELQEQFVEQMVKQELQESCEHQEENAQTSC